MVSLRRLRLVPGGTRGAGGGEGGKEGGCRGGGGPASIGVGESKLQMAALKSSRRASNSDWLIRTGKRRMTSRPTARSLSCAVTLRYGSAEVSSGNPDRDMILEVSSVSDMRPISSSKERPPEAGPEMASSAIVKPSCSVVPTAVLSIATLDASQLGANVEQRARLN